MEIYADNAATTKISKEALNTLCAVYTEAFANPSSTHIPGQVAAGYLSDARERIKMLFTLTKTVR